MTLFKNKKIYFAYLAVFAMLSFLYFMRPEKAHAELIYQVLGNTTSGPGKTIADVWTAVRNIINFAGIAFLIFIAFSNILRININNYAIKKVLPTLVLAIILANFSFLVCRLLIDLANVACDLLINGSSNGLTGGTSTLGLMSPFDLSRRTEMESQLVVDGAWQWGAAFKYIVLTLFANIATIAIFILAFLFYIRNYVIYFLVSLSALAFVATVIPQTKNVFNMWWSNFLKWTFLPIVSLFWLWVGNRWIVPADTSDPLSIMSMAFSLVCFYLAITTPFKMGGTIMQQWGNLGKKTGKWVADRTGVTSAYDYVKKKAEVTHKANMQGMYNTVKQYTGIGTGLDKAQKRFNTKEERRKALSGQAEAEAGSTPRAEAEAQATQNILDSTKEIEATGKKLFSESARGNTLLQEQTRIQTRTAGLTKDTEKTLSEIKRDYFEQANPNNPNPVDAQLKAEVQGYLNSNADAMVAQAEVEKTQKTLTNKLLTDRMAYQNAIDHNDAGAITAIETDIASGTNWATRDHRMSPTEKSRTKVQLDIAIKEEAKAELAKDASTLEAEFFDVSYKDMFAQKPHLVTNTEHKVDYLAKREAVDKVLASRSGGRVAPEAEAMARRLLSHLDTVNMDSTKQASLIQEIVSRYNANLGPRGTRMPTTGINTFTDLSAATNNLSVQEKALFMTQMRSQLTGNRISEQP